MRPSFQALLGLAASLALLGQGCQVTQQADVRMELPDGSVDASVDAIVDDEEAAAAAQANGDAEADAFGNNSAELDAYIQAEYEVQ